MDNPSTVIAQVIDALDRLAPSGPIGIALSGGGDSTALALLASLWAQRSLHVASVDHQLRPESRIEAEAARDTARRLGLPHEILTWVQDGTESGNLSARARDARHRLLGDWAERKRLSAVLLGHTMDDQAETVLLRLQRGSGVDGLSGMAERVEIGGTLWLRPLLGITRAALREVLRAHGVTWIEDPTNDDPSYDRVKLRQAMEALGLTPAGLAETARRLTRQREVLERDRDRLAVEAAQIGRCGEIVFALDMLEAAAEDSRLALIADALGWLGRRIYRPRFRALEALWRRRSNQTLSGCQILWSADHLTICREPGAAADPQPLSDRTPWDRHWHIQGPDTGNLMVGALGAAGLAQLRSSGEARAKWPPCPRPAKLSAPAVWSGGRVVAAPLFPGLLPHDAASEVGESAFSAHLTRIPARFSRCTRL
ncbi:MAG: tRNA lysidine(34) synthetase TilS [Pseudomonadota bacterium]